jgi:hypothetical protein
MMCVMSRVMTRDSRDVALAKAVICLVKAKGFPETAELIARDDCKDFPEVARQLHQKSAVGAQALSSTDPYVGSAEWYGALTVGSVLAEIGPLCRQAVFRTKLPAEFTTGGSGAWVSEGLPIPLYKTTTTNYVVDVFKGAIAAVLSTEFARFGRPSESAIISILRNAVDKFFAAQMFDSTVALTTAHPASLTAGCNKVTSTGSTAAQIAADLASLIGLIQSPGGTLRWIMRPLTFATVCAKLGSVGLTVTRDNLLGLPVILNSNVPRQITLLDCEAVAYAADSVMDVEVTSEATVEMSDAPTQSGISGSGVQQVSLWQSGLFVVKCLTSVNWRHLYFSCGSPTVPQGCVYMLTTY